ncbi:threonine synthase [Bosea caraganae]|uniref:Threonine synthase n=1 Tax=Bosea caraganae TaxID=2763117 RepID=A0A370L4C2_9HYPH|nr:threonine synthase [Bosea caraganae]RDJ23634.1 threonine synthase [Bosea caraganae]RDJ24450.1 threonine synthase [Bosea caraganae]
MLHVSTRGEASPLAFSDALLAGLARDGGLYVPKAWPGLTADEIAGFAGQSYAEVAERIIGALADGDIEGKALGEMIREAYAGFRHPAVCPLTQIGDNLFVLELFHGPTLAFKDVAMQLLGRLMNHVLTLRGERATIVGATSGDTGGAAIDAFKGLERVDMFILYPQGRVSDVQRRQMTTVDAPNVHAIAVEGTFDDCQNLVKAMFNHHAFRDELGLSGVNSINWARIAAQVVYYFTAAVSLGAPARKVSFAVPTGNFGDVLAGWVAKRMGLPIERLMIGTNSNDILTRTLQSGAYEMRGVSATTSPSMDIQISSNFERLLFEVHGRDGATVRRLMQSLQQSGRFEIAPEPLARIRAEFDATAVSEAETAAEIGQTWREAGYLLDPHSAIGVAAARRGLKLDPATPVVVLGTAHPAKFPVAVEAASGVVPTLPAHLADLMEREERVTLLPNDQSQIESFIRQNARTVRGAAA